VCPGHFGHINLPLPGYNSLFFKTMFSLLRGTCVFCYRLRMAPLPALVYRAKLILLHHGLTSAAADLDCHPAAYGVLKPIKTSSKSSSSSSSSMKSNSKKTTSDARSDNEDDKEDDDDEDKDLFDFLNTDANDDNNSDNNNNEIFSNSISKSNSRSRSGKKDNLPKDKESILVARTEALVDYVRQRLLEAKAANDVESLRSNINTNSCSKNAAKSAVDYKSRKALVHEILGRISTVPKCSHCGAARIGLRQDSFAKIFAMPLGKPRSTTRSSWNGLQLQCCIQNTCATFRSAW
jgi:DNA-directed RNA polymerase I subunit RPA1